MDNELFELCRRVLDLTGWDGYGESHIKVFSDDMELPPVYSSDYLLAKLPKDIRVDLEGSTYFAPLTLDTDVKSWDAYYARIDAESYLCTADTPLKSLLKLTLALHKAGEL